jgi:chaperonin GroEL (HSP60 family)
MRLAGLLFSILFLAGCESIPFDAYRIESEKTFIVSGSAEKLCSILSGVAEEHQLVEQKPRRDTTLCYFMNEVEDRHLLLGARRLEGNVVVVVTAWNRDEEYQALTASVIRALTAAYPDFDPNPQSYVRKQK